MWPYTPSCSRASARAFAPGATAAFAATLNALAPWSVRRNKDLLRVAEDSDMHSLMQAGDALNPLLRLGGQSGPLLRDKP